MIDSHNPEVQSTRQRLSEGISWTVAGAALSNGLMFVASFPVARILGRTAFGELAAVQCTVGMFAALAAFGLGMATTKAVAECRTQAPDRIITITAAALMFSAASGALASAILFAFSKDLSETTLAAPHLNTAIRIGCGILFLGAIESVLIGTLAGLEDFKTITYTGIWKGFIGCPCLAAGALWGGINGVLCGYIVTAFVGVCVSSMFVRRRIQSATAAKFRLSGCVAEWKLLPISAVPICVSTIVVAVAEWAALAIIANHAGGYTEVGTFTAVNRIFNVVLLVATLLNRPLMPIIAEQLGRELPHAAIQTLQLSMKLTAKIVLPLTVIAAIFSPIIMSLFGSEFTAEWPTLVVALLTAAIAALMAPLGRWFIASDRAWVNTLFFAVWATTMIFLTQLLGTWGAFGLVVARGVAYCLRAALMAVALPIHSVQPKKT